MNAVLGRTLILLALAVASTGAVVAFATGMRPTPAGQTWSRRFAYAFSFLMILANVVMVGALLAHDFSVSYVAQVGSKAVPTWVTIVSLWSSLEGSILFWGLILGFYIAAATWIHRNEYPESMPYAIAVWLACGTFFAFLIAGPANPFVTVPNPPMDGPGPNPLLQNHFLMIVHPPMLYLGYVGMTIPFGLASAALLHGRLGNDFIRPIRNWLLLPWTFLTLAIMLGGWWAYEVLGWGGYWSWDPVENASLLPWLTATAALHSAVVLERRSTLKGWTATLVLSTFLLTILGTFMTRSGVFNSVHSFTQSAIGPTILVFLAIALVWSVALLATRIDKLMSEGSIETAASREGMFLVNNLLFVVLTLTVLIGTVFPLLVEAVQNKQMSVGRPYFDAMSVPIGVALVFLMGIGPALPWGRTTGEQMKKALIPPLIGGAVFTVAGLALGARNPWTVATIGVGGYAFWVTLAELINPVRQRMKSQGESVGTAAYRAQWQRGRRRLGSYIVHAAAILTFIAIAVSSTMKVSVELQMQKGQTAKVGPYSLTFIEAKTVPEPHRVATVARIDFSKNGRSLGTLEPKMNQYEMMREPIGAPDVHWSLVEDFYVSILNIDVERQTVAIAASIHPMVSWIWISVVIMAIGSLIALFHGASRSARVVAPAPVLSDGAATADGGNL